MIAVAPTLPARSADLAFQQVGDGRYVVKNSRTGEYYQLGDEEHFLLMHLDGIRDAASVASAYVDTFGRPLGDDDLHEFLRIAGEQGLLQGHGDSRTLSPAKAADTTAKVNSAKFAAARFHGWRVKFFDPDRLFTWLVPKIWFAWTRAFFVVSAGTIVIAIWVTWFGRHELADACVHALSWKTALLVGLVFLVLSVLHEFAHGLTCKRYGGEVHDIGVLLMYLVPCFYCDVSDAWLMRERSKRLWVTFAGGYFELWIWALATLTWRVTMPDTSINFLSVVILSLSGVQTLLNFNPLIKLDGYYLLSDWLEIPNLRQRAMERWTANVRWLIWGTPCPAVETHGRLLLALGVVSWVFSWVFFLGVLAGLAIFAGPRWGLIGLGLVAVVGIFGTRDLFCSFSTGEYVVKNDSTLDQESCHLVGTEQERPTRRSVFIAWSRRRRRTVVWGAIATGLAAALHWVEVEERASGPFRIRPVSRMEMRAPVAGFLAEIHVEEGERVSPDAVLARLHIPDLATRLDQKRLEIRQVESRLRQLEIGPRPIQVDAQRLRVQRARGWRDLALADVTHNRHALDARIQGLDRQIARHHAELNAAEASHERMQKLVGHHAVSEEESREAERRAQAARAQWEESKAQKRYRIALGTRTEDAGFDVESELARREMDLAEAEATLKVLEAGSRPEEIDAEKAHLALVREEARHLEEIERKLLIASPGFGVVITPRLRDTLGQFVREGDLVCVVEDPTHLEAEIELKEHSSQGVRIGLCVALRARALSNRTVHGKVTRIAPVVHPGDAQGRLRVYCGLENSRDELRSGMSGYARVNTGRRPIGQILRDRALRYLRTEVWYWTSG